MHYLAVLKTENDEYVCISDSPGKAKKGVFDGYNTFYKKVLETKHRNPLVDVTSEWLASRLEKYYRHYLGGKVSIETLEKKFNFYVLELENDVVYKDGTMTPRREQDY